MFACMLSLLKLTLEVSSSIESTLQKFIHEKSCLVLIGKIRVLYTQWSKIQNQYLRRIPYSLRILMMRSWDDGTASLKREQLFFLGIHFWRRLSQLRLKGLGELPTFRKPFEKAVLPLLSFWRVEGGDLSKSQTLWHFSLERFPWIDAIYPLHTYIYAQWSTQLPRSHFQSCAF